MNNIKLEDLSNYFLREHCKMQIDYHDKMLDMFAEEPAGQTFYIYKGHEYSIKAWSEILKGLAG